MMVFWQESIPRRPNNSRTRCLSRREEASTDVMGTSRQPPKRGWSANDQRSGATAATIYFRQLSSVPEATRRCTGAAVTTLQHPDSLSVAHSWV